MQIVDGVRAAVAGGVYLPGEAIPTLKAMSLETHVNTNTVQKAYDELAREGVIYSQRGKGLFVAENGKTSAQVSTRQAVRRALSEGIRSGRAAGMSVKEIRGVFAASLGSPLDMLPARVICQQVDGHNWSVTVVDFTKETVREIDGVEHVEVIDVGLEDLFKDFVKGQRSTS